MENNGNKILGFAGVLFILFGIISVIEAVFLIIGGALTYSGEMSGIISQSGIISIIPPDVTLNAEKFNNLLSAGLFILSGFMIILAAIDIWFGTYAIINRINIEKSLVCLKYGVILLTIEAIFYGVKLIFLPSTAMYMAFPTVSALIYIIGAYRNI